MDREGVADLFVQFGPVSVRRMFGGAGIWADGTMFGLLVDGVIYLKADAAIMADFEREQMRPFVYATKSGSRSLRSYWRMPDRLYDDPEALADWARRSLAAAQRAAVSRRRPAVTRRGNRPTR
ncbi:MAG TPA: TfoX/Sxy family protein [Alphaproteobacteria bacterium]|nr:TfoX/Sxy family protein [Alphaproteobacteria bacterium]